MRLRNNDVCITAVGLMNYCGTQNEVRIRLYAAVNRYNRRMAHSAMINIQHRYSTIVYNMIVCLSISMKRFL